MKERSVTPKYVIEWEERVDAHELENLDSEREYAAAQHGPCLSVVVSGVISEEYREKVSEEQLDLLEGHLEMVAFCNDYLKANPKE